MAKYQIVVPDGSVLLRDMSTGQTLCLSATNGPLVIGTAELTLMAGLQWEASEEKGSEAPIPPAQKEGATQAYSEESASEQPTMGGNSEATAQSPETIAHMAATARPSDTPTGMPDEVMAALERLSRLPPGFAAEEKEEPFLSNIANLRPNAPQEGKVEQRKDGNDAPILSAERTLEAPLEALTQADFEATLASLGHSRDNVEQELGFLREIESEPEDIAELEKLDEALENRYAAVSKRFECWQQLQKRIDEDRA